MVTRTKYYKYKIIAEFQFEKPLEETVCSQQGTSRLLTLEEKLQAPLATCNSKKINRFFEPPLSPFFARDVLDMQ